MLHSICRSFLGNGGECLIQLVSKLAFTLTPGTLTTICYVNHHLRMTNSPIDHHISKDKVRS